MSSSELKPTDRVTVHHEPVVYEWFLQTYRQYCHIVCPYHTVWHDSMPLDKARSKVTGVSEASWTTALARVTLDLLSQIQCDATVYCKHQWHLMNLSFKRLFRGSLFLMFTREAFLTKSDSLEEHHHQSVSKMYKFRFTSTLNVFE